MIRNFWNIKKRNLYEEIQDLEGKVEPEVWHAIDAVRQVGNIGAHWDADVDRIIEVEANEVDSLLALLEMFGREWYEARERRRELLSNVKALGDAKSPRPTPRQATE